MNRGMLDHLHSTVLPVIPQKPEIVVPVAIQTDVVVQLEQPTIPLISAATGVMALIAARVNVLGMK